AAAAVTSRPGACAVARVVRAWAEPAPDSAAAITTSMRLLTPPQSPGIAESVGGRPVVCMDGAVLADEARAQRILAPLRQLSPKVDTFAQVPPSSIARLHMDPEGPTPVTADTEIGRAHV